jgi:hypothetical protein
LARIDLPKARGKGTADREYAVVGAPEQLEIRSHKRLNKL